MKSINIATSNFKKAIMLLVFTFCFGLSSFAGMFYHNATTVKGQNIKVTPQSFLMSQYYWWITDFHITGTLYPYTGSLNYYVNPIGEIVFTNPGPVGKYTISFVLWFEMYENDPNPPYFYESFVLTVKENCQTIAGNPTSENIFNGNVTISTQSQMDAFYSTSNGNKWTKINGDLKVIGSSINDPITSMCNLNSLTEVSGRVEIRDFNQQGNPSNLNDLMELSKSGYLQVISNPQFNSVILPSLRNITGSLLVRGCDNVKTIFFPKLESIYGNWLHIAKNPRVTTIRFSNEVYFFNFTKPGEGNVRIEENGYLTSEPLTMDFNKIRTLEQNLIFVKNKNPGVTNFDNIFSRLESVGLSMVITDNTYLAKCCMAANAQVPNGRSISGNTGNCANLTAVSNDCGTLHKRGNDILLNNNTHSAQFEVFPNPNNGQFEVQMITSQKGIFHLTVLDLMGRTVYSQQELTEGIVSIPVNIENLPQGQYVVRGELNGEGFVKRIAVLR